MTSDLTIFSEAAYITEQNTLSIDYLSSLNSKIVKYSPRRKNIPIELVEIAISNNPLSEVIKIQFNGDTSQTNYVEGIQQLKTAFLQEHFIMFNDRNLTFDSSNEEIERKAREICHQSQNLTAHVDSLKKCFVAFKTVFDFITFATQKNRFEEKHLQSLHSIMSSYSGINDAQNAAQMMTAMQTLIEFNKARYIFEMPIILSSSCLADILLAMPVWYKTVLDTSSSNDPRVSENTEWICDFVGTQSFAMLYQIYNRRDRNISAFPNLPDPKPSHYADFFTQHGNLFAFNVITTPYHHISSKEWANPNWLASVDPCSLGFFNNIPFFMVTHRWSGNGILPYFADMIADTIIHLNENKSKLNNFRDDTFWYKSNNANFGNCLGNPSTLITFASCLINNYDRGNALQFLKS
jgi:hypothetical protein